MTDLEKLQHNKIELALHTLQPGAGVPLLVLHGLGESTTAPRAPWSDWSGPIYGLDFTGHGESTVPRGGGYTAENLMGDVDVALAHLGPSAVVGRGLGAYVALLVAGARPELVLGVVLDDGPGLYGGGAGPGSGAWVLPARLDGSAPDPFALAELAHDVRPPDYATGYVHLLMAASPLASPLIVTARNRPPWLAAVAAEPGVIVADVEEAFVALVEGAA